MEKNATKRRDQEIRNNRKAKQNNKQTNNVFPSSSKPKLDKFKKERKKQKHS